MKPNPGSVLRLRVVTSLLPGNGEKSSTFRLAPPTRAPSIGLGVSSIGPSPSRRTNADGLGRFRAEKFFQRPPAHIAVDGFSIFT